MTIAASSTRTGKTLGDLCDEMARAFDDQSQTFRDKVKDAAVDVQDDILTRHNWPWMSGSDTLTTQAGLAEYSLDPRLDDVIAGVMVGPSGYPALEWTDLPELRRLQTESSASGIPVRFARISAAGVVLWPTPSAAISYAYDYALMADELASDDSEPNIPIPHRRIWTLGVEARLKSVDNRLDKAKQLAVGEYESAILRLVMRVDSGKKITRRPGQELPHKWAKKF